MLFVIGLICAFAQQPVSPKPSPFADARTCDFDPVNDRLLAENPGLAAAQAAFERQTQQYVATHLGRRTRSATTVRVIDCVVHIVWRTTAENLSNEIINSQIRVLNEDFRRTNPDRDSVWPQAADTGYEFRLLPANIVRVQTTKTSFSSNDYIKYTSQGGSNAWDTTRYLNIWVGNLGNGLLGYAQFPGGPAATDGVVILYSAFGYNSPASNYNLGRTATHEVGHWLNLRHIWGDGGCTVDDFIADTPLSDASNGGCAFGHVSCGTVDMIQNYMDYSYDTCMNLFTFGQSLRMDAVFDQGGARQNFQFVVSACNPAVANCLSCDGANNCEWCAAGYITSGGGCMQCLVAGCVSCSSANVCSTCSSGLELLGTNCVSSAYCTSGATSSVDSIITSINFNGNSLYTNGACRTYTDLTSTMTPVEFVPSQSISYSVGYGDCDGGSAYAKTTSLFCDFTGNRQFESGERLFTSSFVSVGTSSGSFTVPANSMLGDWRCRVVTVEQNSPPQPCGAYTYGQTVDIPIRIGAPCVVPSDCGSDSCFNYACNQGQCSIVPLDCDDSNPCTDDSCSGGCQHSFNTASCEDGNACTNNDQCSAGSCVAGTPLNCDDSNVCTDDSCNAFSGCQNVANSVVSCDDGDACSQNDQCAAGTCSGSAIENCCVDSGDCTGVEICQGGFCAAPSCSDLGGAEINSGCWFLGSLGQNCVNVCAARSGVSNRALTAAVQSSSSCLSLAQNMYSAGKLPSLFTSITTESNKNYGCYYYPSRARLYTGTKSPYSDSSPSVSGSHRYLCACNIGTARIPSNGRINAALIGGAALLLVGVGAVISRRRGTQPQLQRSSTGTQANELQVAVLEPELQFDLELDEAPATSPVLVQHGDI